MNIDKLKVIIASGPVIVENGKVLLNRHGHSDDKKPEDSIWKFPGGRIENFDFTNEANSLEEAAKREVREEMGIGIKIIMPLKPMMVKHSTRPDTIVILIHYLAKRVGPVKPGADITEWKFLDINKLPSNCAPNIKPVIDEYKRLLSKNILQKS